MSLFHIWIYVCMSRCTVRNNAVELYWTRQKARVNREVVEIASKLADLEGLSTVLSVFS
jgi:hypothetical protein